ncbi:MAG: Type 1 glutamine amidotransferase-like domain-containing protein [Patescibacteria group bacterium]|nr:Type 1 glutamine amidotransferase-like domain-containing protein [Patescibacteria group bacterium]MDD5121503.1 Type 1 glutamine amidotransferase-like domain-containing protein [Patescibacteria group bacterium]MDD5222041.1 Type 1 glutamine amidotransferase-like domain-containing protein [Patescibacteria group bacterium]MDD5396335.1 Type 1 glutamine amidotransferase-like domain-containing protein [Patescibacteria group bacterium]
MKLILGSDYTFILKYGFNLTGISKSEMKIGHIITAYKVSRTHIDFFKKITETIKENGYNIEDFDIEGKTKQEIKDFFKDKNVVYIEAGNTFYLLKAIRETGFADILKELLDEGRVYVGTSCGSYIMCPTIEVANWNQDGKDKFGITDYTALNYVPFVLKVHYNDDKEESVRRNLKNLKHPLHILRDGQGMFCEDGICGFIGDGQEVKF